MSKQHSHTTTPFQTKTFPIAILCDSLTSPANIGALFRIGDAFGVAKIILNTTEVNFSSSRLLRTARGTLSKVNYEITEDLLDDIQQLKQQGYLILALEISDNSTPLDTYLIPSSNKIALIIGNEQYGISDSVLASADQIIHIPMYGQNSSMNVIQATSIALYTITNFLK